MAAPIMMGGGPWGPAPPSEPPPPPKNEGALKDQEQLAILLACGHELASNRVELLDLWNSKRPSVRDGYRSRARRLLAAWSVQ